MTDNSNLPPTSEEVKTSLNGVNRAPVKEVPGLTLFPDYVSKAEEKVLWDGLEALPWCIDYTRKLQYYGYRNELIAPYSLVKISNPIPDFLQNLLDRIIKDKICKVRPDQVIINDYEPGQGIRPHFDRKDYFEEQIVGISLGSDCVMEWTRDQKGESEKHKVRIPTRSMYLVEGLARYKYKHGIPGRKNDVYDGTTNKVARQRRISITFRKVIESQVKKTPRIFYNHEKNIFEEIDQMAPESDAKTDVSEGSSKKRKFDADDYVEPVEKVNPILKQLKQTTISPKAIEGVTRIVLGKFK